VDPYETEADPGLWAVAYRWAARAADAGLGITVHAGEFSPANLAAALRVPGLKRVGHGVYAASEPHLLEQLVNSGATAECCLTCNVILGAVPSYEEHPIRKFVEAGVPVTLNTDLPVHVATTIGREYAIAAALGFSPAELLGFTRNAIAASFTSEERRSSLLEDLAHWEARLPVA
jgi:adenosine deaminase